MRLLREYYGKTERTEIIEGLIKMGTINNLKNWGIESARLV